MARAGPRWPLIRIKGVTTVKESFAGVEQVLTTAVRT